jgi:hypothetical protein
MRQQHVVSPALEASSPGATKSDLVGPFELTLAAERHAPAGREGA